VIGDHSLRLDASAVKSLTLPCVQIIMAAIRTGDSIKIKDPSEAFATAFEDFGLDWMQYIDHSETVASADAAEDDYGSNEIAEPADLDAAGAEVDSSANTELQPTSESVMSKRILTIDDSKTMRDMLMLTLAEAGFDVIQAVEVIRNLRRDPAHKSTPILVLTTESDGDKKNLAREAGATGWMVKPFDPERLVATVRKVAP
jgi:two-component system chemotaxis response regulator CheY